MLKLLLARSINEIPSTSPIPPANPFTATLSSRKVHGSVTCQPYPAPRTYDRTEKQTVSVGHRRARVESLRDRKNGLPTCPISPMTGKLTIPDLLIPCLAENRKHALAALLPISSPRTRFSHYLNSLFIPRCTNATPMRNKIPSMRSNGGVRRRRPWQSVIHEEGDWLAQAQNQPARKYGTIYRVWFRYPISPSALGMVIRARVPSLLQTGTVPSRKRTEKYTSLDQKSS